jgi:ribosomal protein S18 acetylase RimI-like enzyme
VELTWPERRTDELAANVVRVVQAVTALGGAVGWLAPPTGDEIVAWLDSVLAAVRAGRARFAVGCLDGRPETLGHYERLDGAVLEHNAEIRKVMCHPAARGRGLAGRLVDTLIEAARADGIETVILDVRGNNHAAMALYERAGFVVYGRLPDFIAVGDDRFDRVCYRQDLRRPGAAGPRRRGGLPVGAGQSTASPPRGVDPPG